MARPSKYPPELRARGADGDGVACGLSARGGSDQVDRGEARDHLDRVVRKWVRQAEIDGGVRAGKTSEELAEIKALKRENAELRRANEILKSASAFFAAELDRPNRY